MLNSFFLKIILNLALFCASLILLYFSFPSPLGSIPILAWVSLAPFLLLMSRIKSPWLKFLISWGFSQIFLMTLFGINPLNLHTSLYLPGNIWGTLFLLLAIPLAYGSIFFMVSLLPGKPLVQASIWTLGEIFLLEKLINYPLAIAITQFSHIYLIQMCSITGIYGLSFLIILANTALFDAFFLHKNNKIKYSVIAVIFFSVILGYGWHRINNTLPMDQASYRVALIQPNHSWMFGALAQQNQLIKEEYLSDYTSLTQKAITTYKPDLVVWPEGAVKTSYDPAFSTYLKKVGVDIIYGGFSFDSASSKPKNSVFLYSPKKNLSAVYSKEKLAPLFETPLYAAGENNAPFYLDDKKVAIGPLICFESLFPDLARKQVSMGANMLLSFSNDSFFKDSNLTKLHATYSIFRGVEFAKPVIFINNIGLSLACDHLGRVTLVSPLDKTSISCAAIYPNQGITFYHLFPHLLFIFSLTVVVIFWAKEVQRSREKAK
ncbi:MAG: apolipoprotein N-acyltransferase [Candidatus Saganbacteria bacterium]|nr:apolipoprotein N-acyltransferase [Candidatus Saganbacteria bacterium]